MKSFSGDGCRPSGPQPFGDRQFSHRPSASGFGGYFIYSVLHSALFSNASRHLKFVFHICTFAQAAGRFALLHLCGAALANWPTGQRVN